MTKLAERKGSDLCLAKRGLPSAKFLGALEAMGTDSLASGEIAEQEVLGHADSANNLPSKLKMTQEASAGSGAAAFNLQGIG
ncbi:MAG: hypothetical protein P8M73_06385 [Luminiphilus sp.]|nr:hypothetical protein [Luminiphilus sp.]